MRGEEGKEINSDGIEENEFLLEMGVGAGIGRGGGNGIGMELGFVGFGREGNDGGGFGREGMELEEFWTGVWNGWFGVVVSGGQVVRVGCFQHGFGGGVCVCVTWCCRSDED